MSWRFLAMWWDWTAMVKTMKTDQTAMVITVRRDSPQGLHLVKTLRSLLAHPQYRGTVSWTEETFPQGPQPEPGEADAA